MAESTGVKSKLESGREWVVENKLRAVGSLWASGVIGSLAYNWSQPGKASVKIIHARVTILRSSHAHTPSVPPVHRRPPLFHFGRLQPCDAAPEPPPPPDFRPCRRLHAQALTLAALAGAAVVEYYDGKAKGKTTERYAKFLPLDAYSKD